MSLFKKWGGNESAGPRFHSVEKKTWSTLLTTVVLGGIFIIIVSYSIKKEGSDYRSLQQFASALATGLLIAGSCFCIGALTGFLFGIPRLLTNASGVPESVKIRNQIIQNDNLVQISDWITKIIVGVGLTQLHEIPPKLMSLGEYLAPGFHYGNGGEALAANIAIIIVLYFLVIGFLCSYLWTRLYFTTMLAQNQKEINNIEHQLEETQKELDEQAEKLKEKEKQLEEKKNEVQAFSTSFSEPISELKSKQVEKERGEDPHKGAFGGASQNNSRKVTATVTPTTYDEELFTVALEVSSTDPVKKPLEGDVEFFLHPTFRNSHKVVKAKDGVAKLNLLAYGAFTVGVRCDKEATQLEIDLAELKDAPEVFKER